MAKLAMRPGLRAGMGTENGRHPANPNGYDPKSERVPSGTRNPGRAAGARAARLRGSWPMLSRVPRLTQLAGLVRLRNGWRVGIRRVGRGGEAWQREFGRPGAVESAGVDCLECPGVTGKFCADAWSRSTSPCCPSGCCNAATAAVPAPEALGPAPGSSSRPGGSATPSSPLPADICVRAARRSQAGRARWRGHRGEEFADLFVGDPDAVDREHRQREGA